MKQTNKPETNTNKENIKLNTFSIRKKLLLSFGLIVLALVTMIGLTFNLNNSISKDLDIVKNIESPLNIMVEQIIGLDATLTGNAHAALIHATRGEWTKVEIHEEKYNQADIALVKLLEEDTKS